MADVIEHDALACEIKKQNKTEQQPTKQANPHSLLKTMAKRATDEKAVSNPVKTITLEPLQFTQH